MWQRFTFYDIRIIAHYLGELITASSLILLLPMLTGAIFGEWEPCSRYALSCGVVLVVGTALRFAYVRDVRLSSRQALAVVGFSWILLAFLGSFPLYFSGHFATYTDALFDSVSGFTTTGASLIQDLDHLSYADNMFRFLLHLCGGLGLIVVVLSLGIMGSSGSSLFRSEARSEHVVPNVISTTRFIAKITAVVICGATILLFAAMSVCGIEPSRAFLQSLWLAISGFATGGFAPMQQSVVYYHSFPIEMILMILMVLGSISFALFGEVWTGRIKEFFRDIEIKTMFIWVIAITAIFTATLATSSMFSDLPALLRRGVFTIIAAFTTTGVSVLTPNQLLTVFTSGALVLLAFVSAVGGSADSTSGGIKFYRIGIIARSIVSLIKSSIAPASARTVVSYYHIGRRTLTMNVMHEAMIVFVLYVITYIAGMLVCIAHGYDATQSIFESITIVSNGGMITGIASPNMPITLEWVFIFLMFAGRLEFVTLLALVAQIFVSLIPRRKQGSQDRHGGGQKRGRSGKHAIKPGHVLLGRAAKGKGRARQTRQTLARTNKGKAIVVIAVALAIAPLASAGKMVQTAQAQTMSNPQSAIEEDPGNVVNESQLADSSFLYDVSISDLQNADPHMDGQTVQVNGEVVGDRIMTECSSDSCWITLQSTDGTFSEVIVNMSLAGAESIDTYGRYGRVGTQLQIRGTYNLVCDDHEGISDLHAEYVSTIEPGSIVPSSFDGQYFMIGGALAAFAGVASIVLRLIRRAFNKQM